MVYAEALVILHGYEKIRWPDAPVGEPGNLAGVCPGQYRTVTLTGTGTHAC
ncbi:hypothetical protein NYV52_26465 [Escherichia coli]|nr:hypothetical protein [Escherichia coli]